MDVEDMTMEEILDRRLQGLYEIRDKYLGFDNKIKVDEINRLITFNETMKNNLETTEKLN